MTTTQQRRIRIAVRRRIMADETARISVPVFAPLSHDAEAGFDPETEERLMFQSFDV